MINTNRDPFTDIGISFTNNANIVRSFTNNANSFGYPGIGGTNEESYYADTMLYKQSIQ